MGVTKGPIFLSIMLIITVLQVIIMQTPVGYIFKVIRLVARRCTPLTAPIEAGPLTVNPNPGLAPVRLSSPPACIRIAIRGHAAGDADDAHLNRPRGTMCLTYRCSRSDACHRSSL
jgi:hypothetical protein